MEPSEKIQELIELAETFYNDGNLKAAYDNYREAAIKGSGEASYRLGEFCEKGIYVKRSYTAAKQWYVIAASKGNVKAKERLKKGLPKDDYVEKDTSEEDCNPEPTKEVKESEEPPTDISEPLVLSFGDDETSSQGRERGKARLRSILIAILFFIVGVSVVLLLKSNGGYSNPSQKSDTPQEQPATVTLAQFQGWVSNVSEDAFTVVNADGDKRIFDNSLRKDMMEGMPVIVKCDSALKLKEIVTPDNYKKILGLWTSADKKLSVDFSKGFQCKTSGANFVFKSWRLHADGSTMECEMPIGGQSRYIPWNIKKLTDDALVLSDEHNVNIEFVRRKTDVTYVDLGLPSGTLWATCNVGAANPWDYGDYFAWGETTKKSTYSWSNYNYCRDGDNHKLTKYCYKSDYGYNGYTDSRTTLEPSDDAATANWGSDWRMPTAEERDALRSKCYWVWTSNYKGHSCNGYIVYKALKESDKGVKIYGGKIADSAYSPGRVAHIFLPAAGWKDSDGKTSYLGSYVYYWSSSLLASSPDGARFLNLDSSGVSTYGGSRCYGRSVRPVRCR